MHIHTSMPPNRRSLRRAPPTEYILYIYYIYIYIYLPTAGHPDEPPPRTPARSFAPRLRRRLKRVSAFLRTCY